MLPFFSQEWQIKKPWRRPARRGTYISVVGTGDFGRALCGRLVTAGYHVFIGSRNPASRGEFLVKVNPILKGVPVVTIPECLASSNIVVLAFGAGEHSSLQPYSNLLAGKTLVDVSNPGTDSSKCSQAERVQEMYPNSHVVKCFNTVSAYALGEEETAGESRTAYVCGNNPTARAQVGKVAASMALQVVDLGGLGSARGLERSMQTLFSGWGWPLLVSIV